MDPNAIVFRERDLKHGVSFPVHDVEQGTPDISRISMLESLKECIRSGWNFVPEVVAVSDPEGQYLELPSQNGFLAAVHLAFSQHLPLTLSPDIVWLAILQGFARHVKVHAAQLEGRLMEHPGKHTIQITVGLSEWDWPTAFDQFATALEGHAGPWMRDLQADFSTTGKIERAASQVALMDVFSPYVQYVACCVCGIPSISLQGHEADWIRLREKLALIRGFDADDWIQEVDDILARFVDASRGKVDRAWWQQIYKLTPRYGGEDIEGWLGAFFPYLRDEQRTFTRKRVKGESFTTEIVPPGLSDVTVKFRTPGTSESLRVVSGFVGVEDLGLNGVMPKIGWAVVRNHFMERFVETPEQHPGIKTRPIPVDRSAGPSAESLRWLDCLECLPIDLQLFYNATDGADLFGKGAIHPLSTLLKTDDVCGWKHLGLWNDGSLLLAHDAIVRLHWNGHEWEHQTLGTSFSDFIARLVAANGNEYWRDAAFSEPEILPEWMAFSSPSPQDASLGLALNLLRRQNHRLRSMKRAERDVFVIRPPSDAPLDHLPAPLRSLYLECDGVAQVDGFEIWPVSRVVVLPNTQSRWLEVGAAPGYRIIFDAAADRGIAVISTAERRIYRIAPSFEEFFLGVERAPQALYWNQPGSPFGHESLNRTVLLWPDEKVLIPTSP